MKRGDLVFLIIVAACLIAIAFYTIGGTLQDVDYHDLAKLPLTEQQSEYGKMQTRKEIGVKMQFVSAVFILVCFLGIMLTALIIGTSNAEKAAAKAEQAKNPQ